MIISIWIAIVVVFISSIVRRVGRRGNKNNNRELIQKFKRPELKNEELKKTLEQEIRFRSTI